MDDDAESGVSTLVPETGTRITFTRSGGLSERGDDAPGIVSWVTEIDPALAGLVEPAVAALLPYEAELFDWMARDPGNAQRFARDSVGTLAEAMPPPASALVAELTAILRTHARPPAGT
ncbi:MAG: hypothetical protein ACRDKW_18405 [Actinomycetota bacterium]